MPNKGTFRIKKYPLLILFIFISVVIVAIGLSRWQYYPATMKSTAMRFSEYLISDKITEAYKLTHPGSRIGKKFKLFQSMLNSQLYRPNSRLPRLTHFEYKLLNPFQSYGNKLRRWVSNSKIKINQYDVEIFFFRGLDEKTPMPIRITLKRYGGSWRVVKIYLHAW